MEGIGPAPILESKAARPSGAGVDILEGPFVFLQKACGKGEEHLVPLSRLRCED